MVVHMIRIVGALLIALCASVNIFPAVTAQETPTRSIDAHVLISGYETYTKDEDGTCIAYPGVIGGAFVQISGVRQDLGSGQWLNTRESLSKKSSCEFKLHFEVPLAESYDVIVASYLVTSLSEQSIASHGGEIVLAVHRNLGEQDLFLLFPDAQLPSPTVVPSPTSVPTPVPTETSGEIGDDTFRVVGAFTLVGTQGEEFLSLGSAGCLGLGGYDDVTVGSQIVVRNENDTIIATAMLEPDPTSSDDECQMQFIVDVPDATFYSFEMGRRGAIVYSKQEMEENGWRISLSLGWPTRTSIKSREWCHGNGMRK
jgi:hypothetical protein